MQAAYSVTGYAGGCVPAPTVLSGSRFTTGGLRGDSPVWSGKR